MRQKACDSEGALYCSLLNTNTNQRFLVFSDKTRQCNACDSVVQASLESCDTAGMSPLAIAAYLGNKHMYVPPSRSIRCVCIHIVACIGGLVCSTLYLWLLFRCRLLVHHKANLSSYDSRHLTPLHHAAINGHVRQVVVSTAVGLYTALNN